MTVLFSLTSAFAAFAAFQRELERRQIDALNSYVAERVTREERQFADLAALQSQALSAMRRRMQTLSDAQADRLFEIYFPPKGDGTRRSRDDLFTGRFDGDTGDIVYGVGAYIRDADAVDPLTKKALVAAVSVVSRFGESLRASYDNVYFYTPETRVVAFGPARDDKLMFYRRDAPPDLDISREQIVQIGRSDVNPAGILSCTGLQRRVDQNESARTGVACVTPLDVQGVRVGAIGSSLELRGFFQRAVDDALPGMTNLIVDRDGKLIAYPGFAAVGANEHVERREAAYGLQPLTAAIRADGRKHGVVKSPDGQTIVAFARMDGPGWYFLVTSPAADVARSAAETASWILVIGGLAALLQTVAIVGLARRSVVGPLQRLSASAAIEEVARGRGRDVADLEERDDEIGALACALRSERERSDGLLVSLEQRVDERTTALQAALREKTSFLANMSHELRTPLNGVVAVSEVLGARQRTKQDRELAELIIASGRLLEQVLTDILDAAKIEAGEMRLEVSSFELTRLVRQIAELHRASAESKGLDLTWSVAPDAEGSYRGDPVRLTQILSNLLSNAVKFTQAGRVSLEVYPGPDADLRFVIEDTGIGFDARTGERLFRRFEQADTSITRRFGGTGLGLAICRSLSELMGGAIVAQSTPGEGSRFTLTLPLARIDSTTEAAASAGGDDQPSDLTGVRVLLAEDHPTNQRVVSLILQSVGVELTIVENGRLALAALEQERFDVVLMDMQMPEMDGLTATVALRRRERETGAPRTPVIMLTANALDEHKAAGREAGCDLHVSKPVRPEILLVAIAQAAAPQGALTISKAAA